MAIGFTPTEDLILEVLAARTRLGETLWPFDVRHKKSLSRLEDVGLIVVMHGNVERTVRARFTDSGKAAFLDASYVPPILRK